MEQTAMRLELPSATYHALEQIARNEGTTPAGVVSGLVRQFQAMETANALRQEYQRLADQAMSRTITRAEEKRMNAICNQINAMPPQSDFASVREQRNRKADALIAKSEKLLDLVDQQSPR